MRQTLELLRLFTEKFPPPDKCRHAIIFHEGKLHLSLHIGNGWQDLILDDEDFDKDPAVILTEISGLLHCPMVMDS